MNPTEIIHESWKPLLGELYQEKLSTLSYQVLPNILAYPQKENIFRVFKQPVSSIKVVILGQDPYHLPNYANGLAFAVNENNKVPSSLANIRKELLDSCSLPQSFYAGSWQTLEHWEEQGIFLLNTALTVEAGKPASHLRYWEDFTRRVIWFISNEQPCIWLLWGKKAQSFKIYMSTKNKTIQVKGYTKETIEKIVADPYANYVLTASHPAAESYQKDAGFYGCNHFYFVNKILEQLSLKTINW